MIHLNINGAPITMTMPKLNNVLGVINPISVSRAGGYSFNNVKRRDILVGTYWYCKTLLTNVEKLIHIRLPHVFVSVTHFYQTSAHLVAASWALGDCCVSLKMLKSPHKEIYSFNLR